MNINFILFCLLIIKDVILYINNIYIIIILLQQLSRNLQSVIFMCGTLYCNNLHFIDTKDTGIPTNDETLMSKYNDQKFEDDFDSYNRRYSLIFCGLWVTLYTIFTCLTM